MVVERSATAAAAAGSKPASQQAAGPPQSSGVASTQGNQASGCRLAAHRSGPNL